MNMARNAPAPAMRAKFFTTVIGRVVPLATAFSFTFFAPTREMRMWAFVASIIILVIGEYISTFRPIANIQELRKKVLDLHFKAFLDESRVNDQKPAVRVNLMVIGWNWNVQRHFFQYYQLNMSQWPDANAHFSIKKGFCGTALSSQKQEVHYVDLRTQIREPFGLSKKILGQTPHITAITSVPLIRSVKTLRGHARRQYFGVLNIDATDDLGAEFLADKEVQEHILGFAKYVEIIWQ